MDWKAILSALILSSSPLIFVWGVKEWVKLRRARVAAIKDEGRLEAQIEVDRERLLNERDAANFALLHTQIVELRGVISTVIAEKEVVQTALERVRGEREDAKTAALEERLRAMKLDQDLSAARRLHEDLRHEAARQASDYERHLQNCCDDLEDAREMIAEFNRRRTGPLGQ